MKAGHWGGVGLWPSRSWINVQEKLDWCSQGCLGWFSLKGLWKNSKFNWLFPFYHHHSNHRLLLFPWEFTSHSSFTLPCFTLFPLRSCFYYLLLRCDTLVFSLKEPTEFESVQCQETCTVTQMPQQHHFCASWYLQVCGCCWWSSSSSSSAASSVIFMERLWICRYHLFPGLLVLKSALGCWEDRNRHRCGFNLIRFNWIQISSYKSFITVSV